MVVGARQSFQFLRQKPGFLEKKHGFNLGIGFCRTRLVLPNYKKLFLNNQF